MSHKKKKSALRAALSRVHWKSFIILLLVALWLSPFFATPEFDKSELKKVESVVMDVEEYSTHAKYDYEWITFKTPDGERFYYSTVFRKGKKFNNPQEVVDLFESYSGKKMTVYYTEKRSLSLMSLFLIDYERVVAVECGQDVLLSLDDFNKDNRGPRITTNIISLALLVIALIVLFTPIIKEIVIRNKRRKKKERKKMKREQLRAKSDSMKTGEDPEY